MAEKLLRTRIQQKTDTSENWLKATNFIPLSGEICYYSDLKKFKVGDGSTLINNLSFASEEIITINVDAENETCDKTKDELMAAYKAGKQFVVKCSNAGWDFIALCQQQNYYTDPGETVQMFFYSIECYDGCINTSEIGLYFGEDAGDPSGVDVEYWPYTKHVIDNINGIEPDYDGTITLTQGDIGLGNVGNFKAVSTEANQGLNNAEKTNARGNLGLDNVDNTSDMNKPVSNATQTALNAKENLFRYLTVPTASAINLGQIIQYIGEYDSPYIKGCFYQCVQYSGSYRWEQIPLSEPVVEISGGGTIQLRDGVRYILTNVSNVTFVMPTTAHYHCFIRMNLNATASVSGLPSNYIGNIFDISQETTSSSWDIDIVDDVYVCAKIQSVEINEV